MHFCIISLILVLTDLDFKLIVLCTCLVGETQKRRKCDLLFRKGVTLDRLTETKLIMTWKHRARIYDKLMLLEDSNAV